MNKNKKRCPHCGCKFHPQKHIVNQKYCSKQNCQRARKNAWTCLKLKRDRDYETNKKEAQYKWKINNSDYWARYKRNYKKNIAVGRPNKERAKQKEKINKSRFKKPALKILLRKNALIDLHKAKTINCDCRLILIS